MVEILSILGDRLARRGDEHRVDAVALAIWPMDLDQLRLSPRAARREQDDEEAAGNRYKDPGVVHLGLALVTLSYYLSGMTRVSHHLTDTQLAWLNRESKKLGITVAELLRRIIDEVRTK